MFVVLKKDFIREPTLEMDINAPVENITLFGRTYTMYQDNWKKHIHLKCTNCCDANCDFCIERNTRRSHEDWQRFMAGAHSVIEQMKAQGKFRTLSLTGGEPTICPRIQDVIDLANEYNPTLFSINTNGYNMEFASPGTFKGWLNLSKHAIQDSSIFRRPFNVDLPKIAMFRDRQPDAKVRIQCVLGVSGGLKTLNEVLNFMSHFRDTVDDFSFRSTIINSEDDRIPELFTDLRSFLFDRMVEQTIIDYYVYEVYDYCGTRITLSWSNMFMLRRFYTDNPFTDFLEEIIVHPDGTVSGTWDKRFLIASPDELLTPRAIPDPPYSSDECMSPTRGRAMNEREVAGSGVTVSVPTGACGSPVLTRSIRDIAPLSEPVENLCAAPANCGSDPESLAHIIDDLIPNNVNFDTDLLYANNAHSPLSTTVGAEGLESAEGAGMSGSACCSPGGGS